MNLGLGGHSAARGHADEEVFGSAYDQRVILRLGPFIKPYKKMAFISVVAMVIYTFTQVAVPWLIAFAIDDFIMLGNTNGLTFVVVIFMFVALLNWGTNYLQQFAMEKVGQGVLFSLRRALFGHVQKQSLSYFDKTEVGRLMSRVQGDVGALQEFSALVVMTLGELLSLFGIVAALLILNLKLGLITMTVIPVLMLIMVIWQRFARKSFVEIRRCISIVNAAFNENISGVRVVIGLNRQRKNLEIFDVKNVDHRWANILAGRYSAGLMPGVDILTSMSIGLALYFGSKMIGMDTLEVGVLVASVMYIQRFFDPIRNLTMQYTQLQRSMASGSRIFDLMDRVPDMLESPDLNSMSDIKGKVEFRDVRFSYVEGEEVLKGISFVVNPGETIAVVGPTGAGKTSIISLLSRLYEVKKGSGDIFVDGVDIRTVSRDSLVSQISTVLQEPYLFSGTVSENIKYKYRHASDDQMIKASKAVGSHEFIEKLAAGYDTYLSERGNNLSLGQRQLISFARAVVADPKILILDEATASIDSHTEVVIQSALRKILKGRTAIVIAHRLSTIRGADKILVLQNGEIIEHGNHNELIEKEGLYSHLYNMNFKSLG